MTEVDVVPVLFLGGSFLALALLGIPVGLSLMLSGIATCLLFTDLGIGTLTGEMIGGIDSIVLLAIPFFMLVGELLASTRLSDVLLKLSSDSVGHVRGGLAHVVAVFSMGFAGISASSTAGVAAVTPAVGPGMEREGYDRPFIAALIASAATMANLIPPSIMAIVYGANVGVSIGALFVAGIVPGLVLGICLMIYSYFFGPPGARRARATRTELGKSASRAVLPAVVPVLIVGGILWGWFTPTEAGMVAVVFTVLVLLPVMARSHIKKLPRYFADAAIQYSLPMLAIAGASVFSWLFAYLGAADWIGQWIVQTGSQNHTLILLLLVGLFLIVGQFIDTVPAIIVFAPMLSFIQADSGIGPIHLGMVVLTTLAAAFVTPPYGMTLLLSTNLLKIPFFSGVKRVVPMYSAFAVMILLTVFVPQSVLWLPNLLVPGGV